MKSVLFFLFSFVSLALLAVLFTPIGQVDVDKPESVSVIFGGDVMLGRSVMTTALRANDPTYPFHNIADTLSEVDIAFVNLENPVVDNCPERVEGLVFCADPKMTQGLVYSGVDIVNLANNHTLNYAKAGFESTKAYLSDQNIKYTGDGQLVVVSKNGTSFGFLGFEKSQQASPALSPTERNLIEDSNQKVDVLIVAMHWGVEYKDTALPGVTKLAYELVDLGADVVVGHHPHWVQNIETYKGKRIYYSLGNLVFDQMWSEETKKGLLVKLTFEGGEVVGEELINTYTHKLGQPVIR